MTASDPTGAVQHRDGHWDFVAGSSTPPHAALLADIAAGVDWQWARPNNANIAATRPA